MNQDLLIPISVNLLNKISLILDKGIRPFSILSAFSELESTRLPFLVSQAQSLSGTSMNPWGSGNKSAS